MKTLLSALLFQIGIDFNYLVECIKNELIDLKKWL